MKCLSRILFIALMAAPLTALAADTGAQRLDTLLDGLKSMRGHFEQTITGSEQRSTESSSGELLLQRPGHFRLEYQKPYEQLYIADGSKVWAYDKDLAQVTVRPLGEALGSTPAVLLSGSEPLEKDFRVHDQGEEGGIEWFELRPKAKDAPFDHIRLAMDGGAIREMEMVDSFGQTTRLRFSHIERNPKLPEEAFKFTPPPGVDVIGTVQDR